MHIYKVTSYKIKRASVRVLISFLLMSCKDPGPATWAEFHGNNGNTGFTNFESEIATRRKWSFDVGDVMYASPAVDNDGTIYIGNSIGDLFAINRNGTQKWKEHLVGQLSSPAIGASGNIYITNFQTITKTNNSSSLFSLDKDGHSLPNWWFAFPDHGYTTAPPKTWSNGKDEFIFVPVHTDKGQELFTFINDRGAVLMKRSPANCIPDEIVNEGIENPFEFHIDPIKIEYGRLGAVAISTIGNGENKSAIIVYAANDCHLMGFILDPVQHSMTEKWVKPGVYSYYPTPAITGGIIILGEGKILSAYNLMDGKKIWDFDGSNPLDREYSGFYNAPAALLGNSPSYNLFARRIIAVDDKGNTQGSFWPASLTDDSTDASPLVTTKYVYAAFPSGLYTLDLQLKQVGHIAFLPGPKTFIQSSPAIGPDGTIYMVDANGILEAFGKSRIEKNF